MKKHILLCLILLCSLMIPLAGQNSSLLIVCFPSSRGNSLTGEVDTVTYASGNTLSLAKIVHDLTGADIYEIELSDPYSSLYNTVLMEAKEDQKRRARPQISHLPGNLDGYDTILLGFPNWWASIPMPIASFLESYDLSGKKIVPFCTHGGGRLGQSISAIAKLSPGSDIRSGLAVYYGGKSTLEEEIREWLSENGVPLK